MNKEERTAYCEGIDACRKLIEERYQHRYYDYMEGCEWEDHPLWEMLHTLTVRIDNDLSNLKKEVVHE